MASDLRVYGVAAPEIAVADRPVNHRAQQPDMVTSAPDLRLRRYVSGYIGFTASARLPTIQHALPSAGIPLLLEFDPSPGILAVNGNRLRIPPLPVVGLHNHGHHPPTGAAAWHRDPAYPTRCLRPTRRRIARDCEYLHQHGRSARTSRSQPG